MQHHEGTTRVSRDEILVLCALAAKRPVRLTSTHRLRLEMLGLITDGAAGITLTDLGRRCARQPIAGDEQPPAPVSDPERDKLGRRKANRRLSPFW
jgi:hypothetical protein